MTTLDATSIATASSNVTPIPPRFKWLKRFIKLGVGMLLFLIGFRLWWGHVAHSRLQAEIDRIRAAGEPIFPEDFDLPKVADQDNAALLLTKAAESLVITPEQQRDVIDAAGELHAFSPEQWVLVAGMVEQNGEALDLLRRARTLSGADWGIRYRSPAINALVPNLSSQRQMTKVFRFISAGQHRAGRDEDTIDTIRGMVFQARTQDVHPGLIPHLVAAGILGLASSAVEHVSPDLQFGQAPAASVEAVKSLIGELLDEQWLEDGLRRSIYTERMAQLDLVCSVSRNQIALMSIATWGVAAPPSMTERLLTLPLQPLIESDGLTMIRHMGELALAIEAPTWPALDSIVASHENRAVGSPGGFRRLTKPISSITMPSFRRFIFLHFQGIAQSRMAATALAMRLYELDHARRPAELTELVPDYLPEVPVDPLAADGRMITYLRTEQGDVLYSVGEDGVDGEAKDWFSSLPNAKRAGTDFVFPLTRLPSQVQKAEDGQGEVPDSQRDADADQPAEGQPERRDEQVEEP